MFVENCNCQTLKVARWTQSHHTPIQIRQNKSFVMKCLTSTNNLKSMKILSQERLLIILKMVRMKNKINLLKLRHLYNIKDVVLWCNLNMVVINSIVTLKRIRIANTIKMNQLWWNQMLNKSLKIIYRYITPRPIQQVRPIMVLKNAW